MYCTKCGKELANDARFCTYCGAKVQQEEYPGNSKGFNKIKENSPTSIGCGMKMCIRDRFRTIRFPQEKKASGF